MNRPVPKPTTCKRQLSRIADAVEELVRSVQTVIETTKQTVLNVATVRDVDLS